MNRKLLSIALLMISSGLYAEGRGTQGVLELRARVPVKTSVEFAAKSDGTLTPILRTNSQESFLKMRSYRRPASSSEIEEVVVESP